MNHQHIPTWQERVSTVSATYMDRAAQQAISGEIADLRARIAELEAAALAAQPVKVEGELPPLPKPKDRGMYKPPIFSGTPVDLFDPEEMQAYARAALAAIQPGADVDGFLQFLTTHRDSAMSMAEFQQQAKGMLVGLLLKPAAIQPVVPQEPQTKPILMAYCATDLDGHADVAMTIEEAKRRAGPSCDTIIALHDISINYVELEGEVVGKPLIAPTAPDAAAVRDAERYRWLRMQDWFDGPLCVLKDPKRVLTRGNGLGADCPSRGRLDSAIDAALAASPAAVRAMGEQEP